MGLHTYKICRVLPRDPDQKMGRPPREVLIGWDGLTDKEVNLMRRVQEPRLLPGQIAELDGKIVARGLADEEADVEDEVEKVDEGGADDASGVDEVQAADDMSEAEALDVVGPSPDDPVGVTRHATRMLWDAYRRHAAASAELREQTNELNRRAIAQAKELDEALKNRATAPAPPQAAPLPLNLSFDDLVNAVRVGASIFRDVADKPPQKS